MATSHQGNETPETNDLQDFEKDVLDQFGYEDEDDKSSSTPNEFDDEEEIDGVDDDDDDDTDPGPDGDATEEEIAEAREKQKQQTPNDENFKLKSDSKGNLVDGNGKIIAKAGSERRLFEKAQKFQNAYGQLNEEFMRHRDLMIKAHDEIVNLRKAVEYERSGGMAKQLNISPEEQHEALSVYAKLKNDATALEGVKYVLTKLAQRGINIQSLGVGSGAIDPNVITQGITQHIDQRLNPITSRFQQEEQTKQVRAQAQQEIDFFFSQNPDAREHRVTLGKILQDPRFRGMSLGEAWSRLQNYLLRQQMGQTQQQSQQSQAPEPRPSGRSRPSLSPRSGVNNAPMNADTDYKDIVKSVMEDYGTID